MARRQSSIKGQGARIVGGENEPQTANSTPTQPVAGEAAGAAPLPPPESPPPSMADLEAALYQEARSGEPQPAEEKAPWDDESEWPPSPEMELELFEDEAEGEQVPVIEAAVETGVVEEVEQEGKEALEVRAEAATFRAVEIDEEEEALPPEEEESMDETELVDDVLLDDPEVYETEDVLPPKLVPGQFEMSEMEALESGDIMYFGEKVAPLELPDRPLPTGQVDEVRDLASARVLILDGEISEVYEQVRSEVGANASIVNECYNLLLRARDIVMRRELTRIPQAEYYVEQARARLGRAAASRKGARGHAWWIMLWGLIWAMVYVSLLIMLGSQYVTNMINWLGLRSPYVDPAILLQAMVWGGIGGVVAIWYHLFKHVSQRDFDSSYNISYLGKPFFGLILGATVYMAVFLFIAALGMAPGADAEGILGIQDPSITPWIIYLVAWACGFKENRIFGMVDRLVKSIFSAS